MAFITSGYVDLVIGTGTRQALANTASFAVFEQIARAEVQSAALHAGYSLGNTSTNDMVKWLTLGKWWEISGALKKGLEMPDTIKASIESLDLVRTGKKPIPGLSPSTEDGIGGTKFSESTDDSAEGRPQYFSRAKLASW